jgi:hypothetical protein
VAKKLRFSDLIYIVRMTGGAGFAGTGAALAAAGVGVSVGLPIALSTLAVAWIFAGKPIARLLSNSVLLDDQTPNYQSLAAQIQRPNQVVMAAFTVRGEPYTTIAAHPTPNEFGVLMRKGEAMMPDQIALVADDGQVIFTLATPEE